MVPMTIVADEASSGDRVTSAPQTLFISEASDCTARDTPRQSPLLYATHVRPPAFRWISPPSNDMNRSVADNDTTESMSTASARRRGRQWDALCPMA